jgi:hypothetical protein
MKKYAIIALILLLASMPCVMAVGGDLLRIDPYWPTMVDNPGEFEVWCNSGDSFNVKIHLVVTEDCYTSMAATGAVVVENASGIEIASFDKLDFTGVTDNGAKVPATVGYTVASLKDHISEGLSVPLGESDTIYWAWKSLNDAAFNPLNETHREITVTVNAGNVRMLVHLFGESVKDSGVFDMRVPTTPSGFVVPEVATILIAGASFAGLGLYAIKRKRNLSTD